MGVAGPEMEPDPELDPEPDPDVDPDGAGAPALGLMPPVWRQQAPQAIAPAAEHIVYGMATVGAYDWLRERV